MPNTSEILAQLTESFVDDANKFYKGNASAGTRARKTLLEIGKYVKTERKNIQAEKNSRKIAKSGNTGTCNV